MKPFLAISTLVAVATVGTLAFAHGGPGRMFEVMDQNKDGKITTAEADATWKARFTALDKNKDNVLAGDELTGGPHKRFKKADSNNDGKITLAEAQAKATAMFTRFDKNKDKVLTRDEMPKGGGRGHGRGHGRGDCA